MRPIHKFILVCLAIPGWLIARGEDPQGDQPLGTAEISGTASGWTGDSNRPPGPEVRIYSIDGKRAGGPKPESPVFVAPGWHKFKLSISRVNMESMPTFEVPVQANRKYKFVTAPAGYEYRVWFYDVTDKPAGLLFEAIATRSKTPTITWVRPPRVAKPPGKNDSADSK